MEIKEIKALKILNANSNFTIEVMVTTDKGKFRGSSPAGESNSKYEISQFKNSIDYEIKNFNDYLKKLIGKTILGLEDIFSIENELPSEFIGGPSLSLSYALIYGLSADTKKEPYELFGNKNKVMPVCKMIGGGMHASGLGMDIQEILVTTITDNNIDSINTTLKVYKKVKDLLEDKTDSFIGGVDPEGGFISGLDNYESIKVVREAIELVIKESGMDIRLGLDFAASTFYKSGKYVYKRPIYGKKEVDRGEQVDLTKKLSDEFDIFYIEDPVDETLAEDYGEVMKLLKGSLIVGDDLTATTPERLQNVHANINATLIKPNQIGLISKVKEYSELADKFGIDKVVSHRSEETSIPIISDLATGLNAKYLKVGINRGERIEKINRLIEIN
jgi:enolase